MELVKLQSANDIRLSRAFRARAGYVDDLISCGSGGFGKEGAYISCGRR